MNKLNIFAWTCLVLGIGILIGMLCAEVDNQHKKYKMNLKCVQGELYEEIRPNFYVKSHLECFEQRSF